MNHLQRLCSSAFACLLAATMSPALAQSLGELAPADVLLALEFQRPAEVGGALFDELASLPWEEAGDTLRRLAAAAGEDLEDVLGGERLGPLAWMTGADGLERELAETCPSFPADVPLRHLLDAGIVTVGMGFGSPFPTVVAIGRAAADRAGDAARAQDALVACFGSDELTQDGVSIHILGQGSDLPLAVARTGDLYVAATTPDAVRGVLRRASGSTEPNLAETALWQATSRFEGAGLGVAVDLASIARLVERFAPAFGEADAEDAYARDRALALLRTLGGVAVRAGLHPDGVLFESAVAVDPEGGDPELAELLLCRDCGVGRPFLAPAGIQGVSSQRIPVRAIVSYVEGWIEGLASAAGEPVDLKTLTQDALGIDLDVALLDWVGEQVHIVTLEPFRPTLGQLVYGQPVALVMPVASPEAAERGLEELGRGFAPLVGGLLAGGGPWSIAPDVGSVGAGRAPSASTEGAMLAVREVTYEGITYDRIQTGPTLDVAVGLLGNHLVVATPSSAMERIVDTFRGDAPPLDDAAYRRAREVAPSGATAIGYADVGASLAGLAELGHTLAQPLATAVSAALYLVPVSSSTEQGETFLEFEGSRRADLDVTGEVYHEQLPTAIEGSLQGTDQRYRLRGVPAGERVRVSLRSEAFDPYLYLLDEAGNVLDSNDDAGFDRNSALAFASDGSDYLIDVSSFGGGGTGPYTLVLEEGDLTDLPQIDLAGVQPRILAVPATVEGRLEEGDVLPGGVIGAYYELVGLTPGQRVSVALTSDAFDTYLRAVQPDAGVVLAENDDSPDTSRSALTLVATEAPLWIQVTSWSGSSAGAYALDVEVADPSSSAASLAAPDALEGPPDRPDQASESAEPEAQETIEPVAFAELLQLFEIVPDALEILSERVGLSLGHARVEGDAVYRRSLLEVDW